MAEHGASSSNSNSFIYDVFLSFRGEDTRSGFTSHLFEALRNEGIETFRDDPSLQSGDEIRSTLLEAIERSRMSIVVLSEDYASSSWCLDELVKIMECHEDQGRRVILVFYHVDPSDVWFQNNRYGEAMRMHENGRNKDKVKAWRSALSAVANLSGHHCCQKGSSYEIDIINAIVRDVSEGLSREPLLINKLPDELDDHFENVKSLLDVGSQDSVCMLYIFGGDETETTEFVGALYNKIFHEFEVACLVENVSTESKKSATGMEDLQKVLVSKIDRKEQHIGMGSIARGCEEIRQRLHNKRVLLILDDVDSVEQLESLAGGADWFGPGSKIIVTTGDEDIADKHVMGDGVEIESYRIIEDVEGWMDVEEEGDVVGLDDSLRIVINQLKEEKPSNPNVVCITGMGGSGKTTLARKIFENNDVKKLFRCRAWCSVSTDFSERRVLLSLLSCLKPSTSKYEKSSEEELRVELRKSLSRNKYLVVLDDMWEPEVWDTVKDAFPINKNGGIVLITSRNDQVAHYTRSRVPHHKLPSLNAEKGWELFCRKVFGREDCPSDLEPIGKSIVDKCGGLPLAIIAIAGLVAKKERSWFKWSRIEGYVPWHLAKDSTKVMDVLKVSYDNLPRELKPCFLSFGVFPEDHVIGAGELVQHWMAEGLIPETGTSDIPRPEVVGDCYLNQLVDRNLVQVVAEGSIDGGMKNCRIHNLLRELCVLESQVDKSMEVASADHGASSSSSYRTAYSSASASADHGASSSNSNSFIYDVFLSFRGEDTRSGFTIHLYEALCNKGIEAFQDDPKLRLGDEIRSTLLEAIERSGMSIVVLSEEYASSSWCLDELVKIMECHKDEGRRVIPVFYHVEPPDVRHQKNQYAEAMEKHENGRNKDKVKAWRSALSAVANLSGLHCCQKGGSYESDIIKVIVEEVSKEVFREPLLIKLPVKHNPQLEVVKSLLDVGSDDTRCMLYIYGHDGIETTKFVVALYNKIFHQFEVACLVENVITKSKKSATGMEDLQKVLVSKIDRKEQHTGMGSIARGCEEIRHRLHNKRVLLILDDVDSVEQLESLAGGADWFGPGSRIIVTTGDEDVLDKHVLDGVEIKRYFIDECELEGMELAAESNKKRKWGAEEEEGDVVGFDDSLRDVIKLLMVTEGGDPSDHRNVVCITGMGGLGKTTLARKIFNNNGIKSLFPCRAWSCVSKDLNERKVLLDLLSCLKSPTSKYEGSKREDVRSEEELKEEVRKCLSRKKKFLVVLDDIWEPEVWDKVKDVFPNSNNEGMILITSRNNRVANYTSPSRHHKLSSLKTEQSWELFCRKVFGREECPSHLEPIGKSIVEKCGGLPLAIVTIAGLVARMDRSNNREWSRVQECVTWYLAEDSKKEVMGVLKLSYDNLPEELKLCFLYFGVFPEDYEIVASRLIQLWIAEGFIQPEKTGTSKVPRLEVLADKYLDELVERNLVQVVKRRSYDGGVKTCRVHDLLRELCISESKVNNNNFLEICTDSNTNSLSSNSSCCRLSILNSAISPMSSSIKGRSNQPSSTRSLFLFGKTSYADGIMKNFPMLYVLHVAGGVDLGKVPDDLKKMSHLKYLRMDSYNCRGDVLDCLWRLGNLETLDLRGWISFKSSISIWKLERLRHVYMDEPVRLEGANKKPIIMRNLQTLKRVLIKPQTVLLINSELFQNLISLSLMYHSPYSSWGQLSPSIPPPPRIKPMLLELNRLHNLRKLTIDFIKESLSSFDKIVFPPNISKITLRNIVKGQENNDFMSALGRIPTLRVLKLDTVWRTKGGDLNCGAAGDFPKLEVLHIKNSFDLTRLTIEDGAMPHLQHVLITDCAFLKGIPERRFPLGEIKSFRDRFK